MLYSAIKRKSTSFFRLFL